jgi:hypothetical protein
MTDDVKITMNHGTLENAQTKTEIPKAMREINQLLPIPKIILFLV